MSGKTLYLVRHAKSSWDHPGLSDRERPLNKRGEHDAPYMAKRLVKKPVLPQRIISSPAIRAQSTAQAFARELDITGSGFIINKNIYGAGTGQLIDIIRQVESDIDCVMLVGHNPDMTWLVNELTGANIDNVPTCGVATINISSSSWEGLGKTRAVLVDFDYPKKSLD